MVLIFGFSRRLPPALAALLFLAGCAGFPFEAIRVSLGTYFGGKYAAGELCGSEALRKLSHVISTHSTGPSFLSLR